MKALYLYFKGTATQGRRSSPASADGRPAGEPQMIDEGPLVPIQPGAFSRWMANRDRVVSENARALGANSGPRPRGVRYLEATG